jgi:hypothetical protein
MGHAISGLGQAVLAHGLTPWPEAFLLDHPEQTSTLARTGIVLRLARLKVSLAELTHADSTADILQEALSHVQAVTRHMPADAPTDLRFRAHQCHAEILARLGQLDTGYDGSLMLTDALDAFASAEDLLDGSDRLQFVGLWMGRGVTHEILGHRTDGAPSLAHFVEAAQLFESAAALMVEAQADAAERAQCFINLGNACRAAAQAVDDAAQAPPWLDRAAQAYSTALQAVGAGHWPGLVINAFDGLAATHEHRFQLGGGQDEIAAAIGARLSILDEIDPSQAPVDWALAAFELSRAEHWALRFAESAGMSRAALDRLRQARDHLEAAGEGDEVRRCEELMNEISADIAAREGE